MRILAIDPGKTGAYAFWDEQHALAEPMPLMGDEVDLGELRKEWTALEVEMALVEEPFPGLKMSRPRAMHYGRHVGRLEGVLAGLAIPYVTVRPQTWKAVVLKGTAKDKEAAILYASRRFPEVALGRGPKGRAHDGMADALCMLEWGLKR